MNTLLNGLLRQIKEVLLLKHGQRLLGDQLIRFVKGASYLGHVVTWGVQGIRDSFDLDHHCPNSQHTWE